MARRKPRPRKERHEAVRRITEAYAKLPPMQCKGLCGHSCGPIGMSGVEEGRFRERGVPVPGMMDPSCPSLDFAGRCSNYDIRPMVCRLWGVVDEMPCPHGCVPEGGRIKSEEGFALLAEVMIAGGESEWSEVLQMLKDPAMTGAFKQYVAAVMAKDEERRRG